MAINKKSRLLVAFLCIVFSLAVILPAAFAANGTGSGDGSGGGDDAPLALLSSNPVSGQKDVPVSGAFNLHFNKNVINMTVKDNNMQCFALFDSEGTAIPLQVIMADDQVEPEKKRDVVLKPAQALTPGTGYTIKVASSLTSKSGVTLGRDVHIAFTTAGATPSPVISETNQDVPTKTNSVPPVKEAGQTNSPNVSQTVGPSQPAAVSSISNSDDNNKEPSSGITSSPEVNSKETPEEDNVTIKNDEETETAVDVNSTEEGTSIQDVDNESGRSNTPSLVLGLIVVGSAVAVGYLYFKRRKS
ncbi:hypothetical protein SPSYN_01440 [Sporotomaculum syntrophicum]|uniref:SbsA Ig-like domain-containing protein n=1 Tax=Sporotomaculum syntrophicum TaxID=182264 RepID=A0A9D3AYY4_9FIRM|nr:Ig-like domain-containing protein [Sporotomaculum syntrophicum]KAF1085304.1 hypothetical protein SPSYN_01440 [Sporotomaculum syntrophicum]